MSAPTLSPLRKGFAEAARQATERATPYGGLLGAGAGRTELRNVYRSRVLAALLLFALVNVCWSNFGFGRLEPEDFPFDTWTSCAITDYLHGDYGHGDRLQGIKEPPNLAFLGSSLVLFPTAGVDADFLDQKIDGPRHHRSLFFEKDFRDHTGQSITTFDFALPGEMPSDAYLITRFLFRGGHKPDVIVYGVGPRDFMESLLPSPAATDPFQHLIRFGDISDQAATLVPGWQERLNWELSKLLFPYGHKVDLAHCFERFASPVVSHALQGLPAITMFQRRQLLPDYRTLEVGMNECNFYSFVSRPRPPFKDNIAEYRKRYKVLNWNTYLNQMGFLADSMEIARERGIAFVLVSMPITDLNRQLLTPQARDLFNRNLRLLAAAKGAKYLDLDGTRNYKLSEFEDTVHLNSAGGKKLLDTLACLLSGDTVVRTALERSPGSPVSPILTAPGQLPGTASSPRGKVNLATRRESYL